MARVALLSLLLLIAAAAADQNDGGIAVEHGIWSLRLDTEDLDDPRIQRTREWKASGLQPSSGQKCHYVDSQGTVTFAVEVPRPDVYEVFLSYCEHPNRAPNASVEVRRDYLTGLDDRVQTTTFDMRQKPDHPLGQLIGRFFFEEENAFIQVKSTDGTPSGYISADHLTIRQGILLDSEEDATLEGNWRESSQTIGFTGDNYKVRNRDATEGEQRATFMIDAPEEEYYAVYMNSIGVGDRAVGVPIEIHHANGVENIMFNQRQNPDRFTFLGSFVFNPALPNQAKVVVKDEGINPPKSFIILDALWITRHAVVDTEHSDHVEFVGNWQSSVSRDGFSGSNYHFFEGASDTAAVTFTFNLFNAGLYDVEMTFRPDVSRAKNAPIKIESGGEVFYTTVDQSQPIGEKEFALIDRFLLSKGEFKLTLSTKGIVPGGVASSVFVIADAIRLTPRKAFTLDTESPLVELVPPEGWSKSTTVDGFLGDFYYFANAAADRATYNMPEVVGIGEFEVFAAWTEHETNRNTAARYVLVSPLFERQMSTQNQRTNGGKWNSVGRQIFGHRTGHVTTLPQTIADAMKFVFRRRVPAALIDTDDMNSPLITIVGSWVVSTSVEGYYGDSYLHNDATSPGAKSVTYHFTAQVAGKYRFLTYVPNDANRDSSVPFEITDADNKKTSFSVDQTQEAGYEMVGEVMLPAGPVDVAILTDGTTGYVIADATLMMLVEETCGEGSVIDPADGDLIPRCKPSNACPLGSFLQDPDTCVPCPENTFSVELDATTCRAHQQCAPGTEEDQKPSATADRTCRDCSAGTWSNGNMPCAPCTANCSVGYLIEAECIPERDTVCRAQGNCPAKAYIATPADGVNPSVCATCDDCPAGTYMAEPCGVDTNTKCLPCDTLTGYAANTNQTECTPFTPCFSGSYQSVPPSVTADRVCTQCAAGTTDDDRDIKSVCLPCTGGGYHVPAGSVGACDTFRCAPGTYDDDGLASTPCTSCLDVDGYQDEAGQQDCKPMAKCEPGEYQVGTPTGLADRSCVQCPNGQYQDEAEQTSCKVATVCEAGEQQTQALTPTSDRTCAACAPGKFQAEAGSTSACTPYSSCGEYEYVSTQPSASNDAECKRAYAVPLYFNSYQSAPVNNAVTQSWLRNAIKLALVAAVSQISSASDIANVIYLPSQEARYNVFVGANVTFKTPSVASAVSSRLNLTLVNGNDTYMMGHVMPSVIETTTAGPSASSSSDSNDNTTYIAAGVGAGVGLCALVAVVVLLVSRRRKDRASSAGKRDTIAFENPTYHVGDHGGDEAFAGYDEPSGLEDGGGLYSEPNTLSGDGGYMEPEDDSAGYLDVEGQN